MGANKRNSGGRVGVVAGTTCLFAVISLFSFSNIYTRLVLFLNFIESDFRNSDLQVQS